jgi:flagellar M-ring protein FliF
MAAPPATATAGPFDQARLALNRLSSQQKVALIVSLAAAIAVLVGGLMWARAGDFRVLFSNVAERDGGAIITALEQLNVPYRFSEGSGAILVPSDRVHEVRLRLASQGLPRGGSVGFEIMESQKFGISQFAEQVNYQRGLEGELARTIQSIGAVQMARVHLAIPKPSVFVRQEQKPTASVFIQLYAGRSLDPAQIAGITHLVASSVPQLPPGNVSIVDQGGNLLSQVRGRAEAGLDPAQIGYVREIESAVAQRIESILAPIAGPGNARVQVAADVDFTQTEQTAETFRPNTDPQTTAIRSQQNSETANVAPSAQGVPGALSNQPPVPATAPLTSPPVAGTGGQRPTPAAGQINAAGVNAPINSVGQPLNTRKDSTVNYEVDKTIRHTKTAQGAVKRLSVAVVVNHRREVGRDGKPTSKPLGDTEMKQINDLVREAMGFSSERGDTLSVVNAAFSQVDAELTAIPVWKDPDNIALGKDLLRYLVIGAIVAYLLLGVARPLLKVLFAGGPPRGASTGGGVGSAAGGIYGAQGQPITIVDQPDEALNVALATYEHKLDKARQVAGENPQVVANIVKDWMNPNAT